MVVLGSLKLDTCHKRKTVKQVTLCVPFSIMNSCFIADKKENLTTKQIRCVLCDCQIPNRDLFAHFPLSNGTASVLNNKTCIQYVYILSRPRKCCRGSLVEAWSGIGLH